MISKSASGHINLFTARDRKVTDFHVTIPGQDDMGNRHGNLVEGHEGGKLLSTLSGAQSFGQNQKGTGGGCTSCAWWPKRVWSLNFLELSIELPRACSICKVYDSSRNCSRNPTDHQNLQMLWLNGWRLSPRALDLQDSLKTWLRELPDANFVSLL